jgi:N6-L-threonylcarbamoyladenine synthase
MYLNCFANNSIILGIETSCDESAVALVRSGREILGEITWSQVHLHKKFGGVVPELASRKHLEVLPYLIRELMNKVKIPFGEIAAIAVTTGPGLVGSLLIGINFAKAMSYALRKPLISINHIEAHIYANFLSMPALLKKCPHIALVVSGGHTLLFFVRGLGRYEFLGGTLDDACGEAFDKVAIVLGLSYPGGPIIEKIARCGAKDAIHFPRALLGPHSLDFSFSGLKTAVRRLWKDNRMKFKISDVASSFQERVFDILFEKSLRAARYKRARSILVTGGVAANERLRRYFKDMAHKSGLSFYSPDKLLCLDNAAMVAGLGYYYYCRNDFAPLSIDAEPTSLDFRHKYAYSAAKKNIR